MLRDQSIDVLKKMQPRGFRSAILTTLSAASSPEEIGRLFFDVSVDGGCGWVQNSLNGIKSVVGQPWKEPIRHCAWHCNGIVMEGNPVSLTGWLG